MCVLEAEGVGELAALEAGAVLGTALEREGDGEGEGEGEAEVAPSDEAAAEVTGIFT